MQEPPRPTQLMVDQGQGVGNDLSVRRVVTGHDAAGKAVFALDGLAPKTAFGVLVWASDRLPADNSTPVEAGGTLAQITTKGSVIRVMSLPPRSHSPLHRTVSLDFGIVLEGRLDLELDDGVTTTLHPTDVVVQRGTLHAWINPYDEPCKIAFVLLPADPLKALDATHD